MSELRALLFDLDGTLVQTRNSSWQIFQETDSEFGLGVGSAAEFFQLFEENFFEALEALARERGVVDPALVQEHFQRNLRSDYLPEVVPGIAAIVRKLASSYTLMIVSSNTMESVRRVLENNGLADCFAHVFSGEVAPSKVHAIDHVLEDPTYACGRQCVPYYDEAVTPHKHASNEVMLITDTVGDVTEALKAGIRVCGVAWGMHSADRLKAAGAEFVCVWPEELLVYLRDGRSAEGGPCTAGPPPSRSAAAAGNAVRSAAAAAAAHRRGRRAKPTAGRSTSSAAAARGMESPAAATPGASCCGASCDCGGTTTESGCCDPQAAADAPPAGTVPSNAPEVRDELLRSVLAAIGS
ncbi:MAG: HAD family hydrolase [bacterium]|nr:HAD family hydrolase [bacterium]MCY4102399.1 HAD family hydrolase [bacterium]